MNNHIEAIWRERKHAFFQEILPYTRYIGQSGFLVFLSMIGIVSVIQYIHLLQNMTDDFPIGWIGVFMITPFLCYSPLRTWLKDADIVYVMPMEKNMMAYIQKSMYRSYRRSFFLLTLVVLIYWPFYRHIDVYQGALFIVMLFILKLVNYWFSWKERQCAWSHHRVILRTARYIMMLLIMMAWLHFDSKGMLIYTIIALGMLYMIYRLPTKQHIPWQTLLMEEKRTVRRIYSFLSWFVDVPSQGTIVKMRSYLSWLLRFVPYHKRYTFTYLHAITFARTEIGGISVRLILLGGFITYICADEMVFQGWAAVISFFIFSFVATVQLGSLRQVHRHAIWKHIFPIQIKTQHGQLIGIEMVLGYIILFIMLILGSIPFWWGMLLKGPFIVMVVLTIMLPLIRASIVKHSLKKEQDDFDE